MDLVNHLEGRLLFAVPKKGRLQQAALDLLSGSDIQFRREHRLDIALVKNHEIALVFLPAADIPTFVGEGRVDLGITGRDQVAEHDAFSTSSETPAVQEILDLEFGGCSLKVQVPERGPYEHSKQLIGKNIVTSFTGLTARYFAALEGVPIEDEAEGEAELALRRKLKTRIKFVGGSVEAACALGVADGIVDLVESGETMKAAGLKAIATVVGSTAVLIKSKTSSNQELVDRITSRIKGVIRDDLPSKVAYVAFSQLDAQKYALCTYNIRRDKLPIAIKITPGKRAPTVTSLETTNETGEKEDWVAVGAMVLKKDAAGVMDKLEDNKAEDILLTKIENSRTD